MQVLGKVLKCCKNYNLNGPSFLKNAKKPERLLDERKANVYDDTLEVFVSIFHRGIYFNTTDTVVNFNDVGNKHTFDINSQTKKFF